MKYITLDDLTKSIRKNIHKIPHDIDFVIGIPRSGMIVGSIISEYINVPLIDIDGFKNGEKPRGGDRLQMIQRKETKKVLVVDDTCNSGKAINRAKDKLQSYDYEFIYLVAFLEGKGNDCIDIYLEDVRKYTDNFKNIVLYEWNVTNHYPFIAQRTMYDIDGVFCVEPPDERNTEEYENYIKNAIPLFVPTVTIGAVVSYRLSKYQEITEKWLKDNGIRYNAIIMFKGDSYKEREKSGISPEIMKGMIYKNNPNMILFVESDDWQAMNIHQISGKPVLCIETNKLYGNAI